MLRFLSKSRIRIVAVCPCIAQLGGEAGVTSLVLRSGTGDATGAMISINGCAEVFMVAFDTIEAAHGVGVTVATDGVGVGVAVAVTHAPAVPTVPVVPAVGNAVGT